MAGSRATTLALAALAVASGCDRVPAPDAIARENRPSSHAERPIRAVEPVPAVSPGAGRPTPWLDAAVSDDGRTLTVRYQSQCTVATGVDAQEAAKAVTVTVSVADEQPSPSPGVNTFCTAEGPALVTVRLSSPLRGRVVLDGADGRPRPVRPLA